MRPAEATVRRKSLENDLHLNPEHYTTMGSRLRHVREQVGFSVADVAGALGFTRGKVDALEADGRSPTWFDLLLYSVAFRVSLDVLLGWVGPQPRDVSEKRRLPIVIVNDNERT